MTPVRRARLIGTLVLVLAMTAALAPSPTGAQAGADYQIVSGRPAPDGAYPWMAAFLQDGGQVCGGSVVDATWVLTAAHCVIDGRGEPSATPAQVQFVVGSNNWTTQGQTLQAVQIIAHPDYDPLTTANDMALVQVAEAAQVTPVRLPGAGDAALENPPTTARVIGYGTTSTGGEASDILLEVDVDVTDFATCDAQYGDQLDAAIHVCAGNPSQDRANPGRDSCQGDSGGPLFAPGPDPVQIGVVSFGNECGVGEPGVYARVSTYVPWITQTIQAAAPVPDPGPGGDVGDDTDAFRIADPAAGADPVATAIAVSQRTWVGGDARYGTVAASANFPDALGGSGLAAYFGPLLYVDQAGNLGDATLAELQRVLEPGALVYVLGGVAAVPAAAEQRLRDAGFEVVRLGGAGRQQTARIVAEEVIQSFEGQQLPIDAAIVAFEGNWPDAVTVGQIAAWFSIPVLLTPTGALGADAADYLATYQPAEVFVPGGTAVVSDAVLQQIADITGGDVIRLGGDTRLETAAAITAFNADVLYPRNEAVFDEPYGVEVVFAVNLRRPDAFANVLSASVPAGLFGGVFAPLEGDDGSIVDQVVLDSICGLDAQVVGVGGPEVVPDAVLSQLQAAADGQGCTPPPVG